MAEDLVMVSVKLPRVLYTRLRAYAKQSRLSVSELLREGLEWRLGEENDPLAYRYGNTSTDDTIPNVGMFQADQEPIAAERHQAIMTLLREIRDHQRGAPTVGAVIPVIPGASHTADAVADVVIPVIPTAHGVPHAEVIPVIPEAPGYDPTKFVLGSLCDRGHDYASTGQSLRYLARHECVECKRLARQRSKARHR